MKNKTKWVFWGFFHFFYADGDSEPVPIQTDEALEQKIVEHTLLRNELRGILIFSLIAAYVFIKNSPIRYSSLLSFTGVTSTFLFPILYIFTAGTAAYSIIRILKARSNIKKGLPIEKPTMKSARRHIIILYGSTWIILLLLLLSFIADAFFVPDIVVFALLGPGVGAIIGIGSRYYIKKKATKKEDGLLVIVFAVIIAIIFIHTIGPFIMEGLEDIHKVDSTPEGYPIITLKEITKESGEGSISREFKPGKSPIVPKHYTFRESENINGNEKSMSIKYYKTINSYFAEVIFNGITERLEKGMKWRGMTIFTKNIITDDEMKNLWDVDNMALTEERDEIIIQKGNIVLHLDNFSGVMDFNDKHTRELIISRFFSDSSLEN